MTEEQENNLAYANIVHMLSTICAICSLSVMLVLGMTGDISNSRIWLLIAFLSGCVSLITDEIIKDRGDNDER